MNYELAKELKDAGFPQKEFDFHNGITGEWPGDIRPADFPYNPTLEELIEACGDDIFLGVAGSCPPTVFFAKKDDGDSVNGRYQVGATYKEAVARLWLALNKNK